VTLQKLKSTDAFVVVDLDGAETSTGIVRWAKRILVDGATNLARVTTYTYASFGIPRGGASAGVSAPPEGREAALAAFVEELGPQVAAGALRLAPGKGVDASDFAAWGDAALPPAGESTAEALAAGVVAAAAAASGGSLAGVTVAVEDIGPATASIVSAFTHAGAEVSTADGDVTTAEVDVLAIGSKAGVLHHEAVPGLRCKLVVPTGPIPITARALAHGRQHGIVVLPDFVTAAGPTLLADPTVAPGDGSVAAAATAIAEVITEVLDHEHGPLLGACLRAEENLRTWHPTLPFGRPIA